MQDSSFARYLHRKRSQRTKRACATIVHAYLCEVLRRSRCQESHRQPTWCSLEETKRRLRRERDCASGEQLAYVVDLAVAHIRRVQSRSYADDSWRRVCFEMPADRSAQALTPLPATPRMGTSSRSGSRDRARRKLIEGEIVARTVQASDIPYPLMRVPQLPAGAGQTLHDIRKVQVLELPGSKSSGPRSQESRNRRPGRP
jgi:hypothetical protein